MTSNTFITFYNQTALIMRTLKVHMYSTEKKKLITPYNDDENIHSLSWTAPFSGSGGFAGPGFDPISLCCCGDSNCVVFSTATCAVIGSTTCAVLASIPISLSLTLVKTSPNRFCPLHDFLFHARRSSSANPIPHILSMGLASTSVLGWVLNSFAFSLSFCEN